MSTKTGGLQARPDLAKFLITELMRPDGTGQAGAKTTGGVVITVSVGTQFYT